MALVVGAAVAMAVKTGDAQLSRYKEVLAISTTGGGRFEAEVGNSEVSYTLRYITISRAATCSSPTSTGRPATNGDVIAFLCGGGDKRHVRHRARCKA